MLGRLLWMVALGIVGWLLLRGSGRRARSAMGRTADPPVGPPSLGLMVRDRVCDTFLPRERAVVLREDGLDHFFCSEACMRVHRSRGSRVG